MPTAKQPSSHSWKKGAGNYSGEIPAIELYRQVDTDFAAGFLNVSPRKMELMRQVGSGPRFVRVSRKCVRYRIKDLIEFQEQHIQDNTIYDPAA